MFKKLISQKLYVQIVDQITDLIEEGKLKNGDKLPPERVLSKKFNVSRATIREAMSALEISGLVNSKGSLGYFITTDASDRLVNNVILRDLIKNHSPFEVFETRSEIEPMIGAMAANKRNKENLEELRYSLGKLNSLGRNLLHSVLDGSQEFDEYMEEDRNFHLVISKSTHNSVIYYLYSNISLMLKEKMWKIMKQKSLMKDGNIEKFEKEHTDIFNAIRDKDPVTTKRLIKEHMENIENDMFN